MKKQFPDVENSLVLASILLANVYAASGDNEKASGIKDHLYRSGAQRKIGITVTELNGNLLQFCAHGQSHPRSVDIYAEINRISKELIEHGHEYDVSSIVRSIRPDETIESILCGHSERFASSYQTPAHWHIAKMILLTKTKGGIVTLNETRPISLLPCFSKIYEKCFLVHLRK
ncbi:unnamed protein product [Rotaria socialis]|nr:unnamed protein product [Rotaria socialis]CAF4417832.1 unnamed protein product [Rotaria socialis]CAF4487772.1 unnamed protein product [Rotaria socialis]CAF4589877.1 unnamed protein product [Rotaria socialis]CAF4749179.1 unnamed protein product [Rotaria socialis]